MPKIGGCRSDPEFFNKIDPIAVIAILGQPYEMEPRYRYGELLSADAKLRLVIYDRADFRYMIVEERVRSYKAGDADNPEYVSFPRGALWEPYWQIFAQPRGGIFETVEDAINEGRLILANGS